MRSVNATTWLLTALALSACGHEPQESREKASPAVAGAIHVIESSSAPAITWASAVAEPYARATLSTKLMGTVTAVHVREGDMVRAGQPLVTIDARDLTAKDAQVEAGITEAEATQHEAMANAQRIRALFAEDAAPRAQLDAAETGLARANAGLQAARAARAELSAVRGYSVVRSPFAGQITARLVDPGAFAAPGAPLLTVQDARRLRVTGSIAPSAIHTLARGLSVDVTLEGMATRGVVEAVVPTGGNLYRVNVILDNATGKYLPGSAAAIGIPQPNRGALFVPVTAVQQNGDLTGVYVRTPKSIQLRWIQIGRRSGDLVEVLAGLRAGEQIVIPAASGAR